LYFVKEWVLKKVLSRKWSAATTFATQTPTLRMPSQKSTTTRLGSMTLENKDQVFTKEEASKGTTTCRISRL
jgi:hypothetical protein